MSNGLPHLNGKSPNAATAVLGRGSNAVTGEKMSPAAQKMSTIASTVASLQVIFSKSNKNLQFNFFYSGQPSNICWPCC